MHTADEDMGATSSLARPVSEPTPSGPAAADVPSREEEWRPTRRFLGWLAAITLGGLVLRVVFTLVARGAQRAAHPTDDQWYFNAGRMLAQGWGFGNPLIWANQHRYVPSAGHPPLYPVLLGAMSFIGIDTPQGQRVATCVLGALAVLVLGLTARELAGDRAGLIVAALAAVYPNLWINDAALLSETPFVLLTALFLYAAIRVWRRPTIRRVAEMSLWVALASLTRSEAVLLYPLAVLPLLLRAPGLPWPIRWERVGIAAAVAFVVIAPWVAYNNLGRFKHPVFIVSGSGVAMSYGNCGPTYSGTLLGYWDWNCGVHKFPRDQDETTFDAQGRKKADDYIRAHLGEQPRVIAARVGRLFQIYRPSQSIVLDRFFERRGLWPSRFALAMYYPVTLLGIAGAVVLWRRKLPVSPYIAITVTVTIAAALTFGVTRYRAGFDASATVLAGVAIDAALRWRRGFAS